MPAFKYQPHESLVTLPFEWHPSLTYGISLMKGEERPYIRDFVQITQELFEKAKK